MKKKVTMSLDEETIEKLKELAEATHRNVSQWVTEKVWETVNEKEEKQSKKG